MASDELRDYRMMDLPGYMEWSERKLAAGLIAHLDATSALLRPSDLEEVSAVWFDEMLEDLEQHLTDRRK